MSTETAVVEQQSDLQSTETQLPALNEGQAATQLMDMVQQLAANPNIDLQRVDHAFKIFEKFTAMEAEKKFNAAMAEAQMKIGAVVANQTNSHTRSTFADLSAIHKQCKPIWTECGFSVSSEYYDAEKDGWIGVKCEVMHAGGFKKEYKNIFPLDMAGSQGTTNKTAIQAIGSTGSYARRYIELMIFDISIDRDNDGNGPDRNASPAHQPLNGKQIQNLKKELEKAGIAESTLCEKSQVSRIEEILQGRLKGIVKWIGEQKPPATAKQAKKETKRVQNMSDDEFIQELNG